MCAGGISNFSIFGMVQLPMSLAPFGALVITSVIIPQASFIGHLSGILMGYVMAYVLYGVTVNLWASLVLLALLGAGKRRQIRLCSYCSLRDGHLLRCQSFTCSQSIRRRCNQTGQFSSWC